jgi:hypothetical protein
LPASAAVAFSSASFLPTANTDAPAPANLTAAARPMPLDAPVTITVCAMRRL